MSNITDKTFDILIIFYKSLQIYRPELKTDSLALIEILNN
jgi:hypothetical protein